MVSSSSILILGHGRVYKFDEIRCSPLPVDIWYDKDYYCIDINPDVKPDFVYDLNKLPWSFISSSSYSLVIDTCGILFMSRYKNERFIQEIKRILTTNGIFYGYGGFIFQKTDEWYIDFFKNKIKLIS